MPFPPSSSFFRTHHHTTQGKGKGKGKGVHVSFKKPVKTVNILPATEPEPEPEEPTTNETPETTPNDNNDDASLHGYDAGGDDDKTASSILSACVDYAVSAASAIYAAGCRAYETAQATATSALQVVIEAAYTALDALECLAGTVADYGYGFPAIFGFRAYLG